ncbi:MAG: hypothetical protein ACYTG6_03535 [Planctomycetota bacterium]|jgi:hypothetical protein
MKPRTALFVTLALFVAGIGASDCPLWAAPEGEAAAPASITIHCEVWRAWGAPLVKDIEALSERDASDAAAVRAALQGADDGAERLSRFLTPMAANSELSLQATHQVPQQVTSTTTGGAVTSGFGGFVDSGTSLNVRCRLAEGGEILTNLFLRVSGSGDALTAGPRMPPARYTAELTASLSAASGTMLMVQSNTKDADTLYMFFKATRN